MPNLTTVAQEFKENFYLAARDTLFKDLEPDPTIDPEAAEVYVVFGRPVSFLPPDIVAFGGVRSSQVPGPISTNRARDETLDLDVFISVQRGGRDDATELLCSKIAYRYLGILEDFARSTDTTIGESVRDCFIESHRSEGASTEAVLKDGRCIDINATFRATARISN